MAYTFNGTTKQITLPAGMVTLDLIDVHSRWKDWILAGHAECLLAFSTVGGEITEIPLYLFMQNGWQIVPQSANHTLTVTNGILVGQGAADPFTDPAGSYKIRINRQAPGIAIGYSTSGGSGPTAGDIAAQVRTNLSPELLRVLELALLHGLDAANPLTVTPTTRVAGTVSQAISGDGTSTSTVTRV